MTTITPTVYVVLLNYNGWQDTIACAQSVLNSVGVKLHLIICDNASSDQSHQRITQWAAQLLTAKPIKHPRLARLIKPCATPRWVFIGRSTLEKNPLNASDYDVTIIDNQANLGFAAGCNIGLRYALAQANMSHVWLLNNDTLVEPDCLSQLLKRLNAHPAPALIGSRLMFYDEPSTIQTLGGNRFNPVTGNAQRSIGRFSAESKPRNPTEIEASMDYISGCSMLVPRHFLEHIGLMNEAYFLYYEEIEWALRARGHYDLLYADDAVVYHKEGSSIGSASLNKPASLLSEFYCFRNKIVFTQQYYPWLLPTCYLSSLLQAINRARRGHWQQAWQIVKILLGQRDFVPSH